MSEPIALRYDFDGNGYLYMDAGSGSDWASRVKDCEFLYTHPMRELTDDEIVKVLDDIVGDVQHIEILHMIIFAKEILQKARE